MTDQAAVNRLAHLARLELGNCERIQAQLAEHMRLLREHVEKLDEASR